jgi:hypothetical protein
MRFRSIVVFVTLLCAVSAFGQVAAPLIQSVNPAGGPVAGGTLVTLTGFALNPSCGAYMMACPEPVVRIGGRPAQIVERAHDRLVVVAPANSNGRADIEITTAGGTHRLTRAFAYGATDFHRLLLPVFIEGAVEGLEGSRWVTELSGFHRETNSIRVTGNPDGEAGTVTGRVAFTPAVTTARQGFGRFIYVSDQAADDVNLNLRARDTSREAENLGTEIPVISAEQTFAGTDIVLVNVPTQEQYRQKIRVYDFDGEYGRSVTVHIYGNDQSTPIVTRTLTTSQASVDLDYPAYPGQAEIDLNGIAELAGLEHVTVIVETPDEGRWWAFASITNNSTQLITTVTP